MSKITYNKFIVMGSARSGTNLVCMALNTHPNIMCHGEAFHPLEIFLDEINHDPNHCSDFSLKKRNKYPVKFLNQMIFKSYPSSINAVGLKILHRHLFPALTPHLKSLRQALSGDHSIKIINLYRRNLLEQYLSLKIARKTDRWLIEDKTQSSKIAVHIDPKACETYFRLQIRHRCFMERLFSNHESINICYENLNTNTQEELAIVQNFLNILPKKLEIRTFKQEHRPISEAIVNYSEVESYFQKTHWNNVFCNNLVSL